ncbi:MAG: metalloregulator ArsR/SmtB family transcription factor [Armatimonadota bacterium]|nr:metalloregulator ArsR/SmtB family transcription factor [Armatimonadota bacterium]
MNPTVSGDVFQAIADPTRRRILESLRRTEQPVSALAGQFPVTLSAVSQHMRVLREAGLVSVRRAGRERFYRLNPAPLRPVFDWLEQYQDFWQDKLSALGDALEENL